MELLQIVFLQHHYRRDKKKNRRERNHYKRVIYLQPQGQPRNHYEYLSQDTLNHSAQTQYYTKQKIIYLEDV